MNLKNQIELELYFADHFDTILFPVLAELYLNKNEDWTNWCNDCFILAVLDFLLRKNPIPVSPL